MFTTFHGKNKLQTDQLVTTFINKSYFDLLNIVNI